MEWISTEERLPWKGVPVLVYVNEDDLTDYGKYRVSMIKDSGASIAWVGLLFSNVTHWMPLPPPPEQ